MQKCALLRFVAEKELLRLMKFQSARLLLNLSLIEMERLLGEPHTLRRQNSVFSSRLPHSYASERFPSLYAALMLMHASCDKHAPGAEVKNGDVSRDRA